jgi:hypothetical protein
MNSIDLILLNFDEVRRRSIKIWTSIPEEMLQWKPDDEAMNCQEMIRHVLESEHYYHLAIKNREFTRFRFPFRKSAFHFCNF